MLQINENLRLERQYVERLFESITDGVIAIDPELRITAINDAAREALALESKEGPNAYPVGGDVLLLPRQIAEAVTLTLEESLRYTNHVMEVTRRDGESITLRFSTRTIRTPEGELEGIVAIFEDISVLRRLEDQMIRSEKLASVGELAAGIAHELGNPMGIIRSCAGYLKEKWRDLSKIPPESREKDGLNEEVDVILGESERCQGLLKRLLSLSSRSEPEIKEIPVQETLEKAVSLVRYQKEADGIDFQVVCDEDAMSWRADPNLLEQALINILLNAVQAMDGGGKVEIRTFRRTRGAPGIPTEGPLNWVRVEIEDEGCGVPAEQLEQVFDPFFTTKEGGTGLGLSITHRIVERMSGQITVRPGKEKGTCVSFVLPAGSTQESEQGG
jgi:PAS domain S-box-containing protein